MNRNASIISINVGFSQQEIGIDDNSENLSNEDLDIYKSLSYIVQLKISVQQANQQVIYVLSLFRMNY